MVLVAMLVMMLIASTSPDAREGLVPSECIIIITMA